jgi:hypothetical protein
MIFSLIGCEKTAQTETSTPHSPVEIQDAKSELVERAKAVLRGAHGFDMATTQFRNIFVVEGNAVCGEITWADMSGTQRGYVPFMYRYGIGVTDDELFRSTKFVDVWMKLCEGRPVILGKRNPLPEHHLEDFAQRLRKFKAAGSKEEPDRFLPSYWEELAQIEADLDKASVGNIEATAAKKNAEVEEFTKKMREE